MGISQSVITAGHPWNGDLQYTIVLWRDMKTKYICTISEKSGQFRCYIKLPENHPLYKPTNSKKALKFSDAVWFGIGKFGFIPTNGDVAKEELEAFAKQVKLCITTKI